MNFELILVDDDEVLLIILEKMFKKVRPEAKLTSFNSGWDALNHLTSSQVTGKKRFLLVDLFLKDLSGWEFLDELVERKDDVSKVFLFTSSVNSINSEIAKKYGLVIDFFEKPITYEKINRIIELIEKE